jgi:hypothetical protein
MASWRTWRAATGYERLGPRAVRARALSALLIAAPLLFGIPVLLGIAVTVVRLLGVAYPYLGWSSTTNGDPEMLYLGHTIYQSPAHGYTGMLYTPLFPTIVSLLYHIHLWSGWPLLVVVGACASIQALATWIAYTPGGPSARPVRMLGAFGIGGIAYWCLSSLHTPQLDEGQPDHVAWAFALLGLVAVASLGPAPSRRRVVLAALLLSAGLWAKQPTVAVTAVALVWMWGLLAVSAIRPKAVLLFTAVLVGVNLAVLLVLNLLTDGWELYINFQMPSRHAVGSLYGAYAMTGLRGTAVGLGFVAAIWLSYGAISIRRRWYASRRTRKLTSALRDLLLAEDPTGRRTLLLGLYIPFGFAFAMYCLRKQGTSDNEFIGVVWALGLLVALGWRVAQRHAVTAAAAGGCIVVFFALTQFKPFTQKAESLGVVIPALERTAQWQQLPNYLIAYARHHTIYMPKESSLNVPNGGPLYPNYFNIADLLAAGEQPMYLVRALLDRRFEAIEYFSVEEGGYTSGLGKWEENYMWKLNEVIAARYTAEPGVPPGMLGRRPGPERAAWMRYCFGPFAAGGASFRIRHGGGFWCSLGNGVMQLVEAPVPISEVLTTQPVQVSGTIILRLAKKAESQIALVLEAGGAATWTARVATVRDNPRLLTVTTYLGGVRLGSTVVTAGRLPKGQLWVKLALTPTSARPGPPSSVGHKAVARLTVPTAKAPLSLRATNGTAINLKRAHLVS